MKVSECNNAAQEQALEQALGKALCEKIGEPRYNLWFHTKTKFSWEGDRLTVGVPNRFFQEWLQRTFLDDMLTVTRTIFARAMQVSFVIDAELFQASRRREMDNSASNAPAMPANSPSNMPATSRPAAANPGEGPGKTRGRRWRRLEDFIPGPCNQVPHAWARSIVEGMTAGRVEAPNPLVVHGPVGTGKTHLLEGIYAGLRHSRPDARVLFLTAEDFTNRFLQAMRTGKLPAFRKQVRECDALLVDDMHFLARKLATQEEFLHTFDALVQEDRPVIATCDCHPRLADQFLPELTDRLGGGAIWGLEQPDADTRKRILQAKVRKHAGEPLPAEVIQLMAQNLRGNVRELEGALFSLLHLMRVTGRPCTLELANEALAEVMRHSHRAIELGDIEQAVNTVLHLQTGDLQSKKRSWMYSHPRMLAVYLARKHTGATYGEIGKFIGRNHSTAVAGEKKVRDWLRDNADLTLGRRTWKAKELIERIERELQR